MKKVGEEGLSWTPISNQRGIQVKKLSLSACSMSTKHERNKD